MSEDLDTLLRDAGRAPTIDLDVAAVHAAGRRRAATRRAAAGVGALALAGVVGLGVQSLVPDVEPPYIDADPTPTEGEVSAETSVSSEDVAGDERIAAELGVDTVRFVSGEDGLVVLRARPGGDGSISQHGVLGVQEAVSVDVAADGSVWWVDPGGRLWVGPRGNLLAQPELYGVDEPPARMVSDAFDWSVLGRADDGELLLGARDTDAGSVDVLRTAGDELGDTLVGFQLPLRDVIPFAAALGPDAPEQLVLLVADADGATQVVQHLAGSDVEVLLDDPGERWFSEVAVVGRTVVVVERGEDGTTDLLLVGLDGGAVRRLATPVGRGIDGAVVDLSVVDTVDPAAVAMTVDLGGGHTSVLVDLAAASTAGDEQAAGVEVGSVPDGVFTATELPGRLFLLPPGDPGGATELAACARPDQEPLNRDPNTYAGTALWFLCWDGADSVSGYPFAASVRLPGASREPSTDELDRLLELLFLGPTLGEQARGLSGVVSSDVATFDGLTVSADGIVTVAVRGGPQVGVLGTTTGRATFVQAVVSTVLQHPDLAGVVITLDGTCEGWEALGEGDGQGCTTYDRSVAAWTTTSVAGECAEADEDFNGAPAFDTYEPSLWFSCLTDGGSQVPYPFYRVDAEPTDGTLEKIAAVFVEALLDGPTAAQQARGLSGWHAPGTVATSGVTIEDVAGGLRATVAVDDVEEVPEGGRGIPTGAGDGYSFRAALAGVLLQLDGVVEVVIVANGSCGEWEGIEGVNDTECIVWTLDDAPWVQRGEVR